MSELTITQDRGLNFRRNLLAGVSLLALIAGAANAAESDTDRPLVWIELGGQMEDMSNRQEPFTAPFVANLAKINSSVIFDAQKPLQSSLAGQSRITFQPEDSDWIFSAAVRFGRSGAKRHLHHQTALPTFVGYFFHSSFTIPPDRQIFGDAQTSLRETHSIADFQAGKDVGLGLFGGRSVVSAGVRFAQFTSGMHATLHARPIYDLNPVTVPGKYKFPNPIRHTYTALAHSERSFHAIGPSLSWDASAPVAGHRESTLVSFDWGVNAAILFGRQKAHTHHQTTGGSYQLTGGIKGFFFGTVQYKHTTHYTHVPADSAHIRSVIVPNIGGFAGISLKLPNVKASVGYRADFFFGAMDGGVGVAKKENVGFYGPFATISVGIGG